MNQSLPQWLERWLGVAPAKPGEGTMWTLESSWSWAPWITLLFCAAVAGLVVVVYLRETTGRRAGLRGLLIALRLAAVILVLVMISQMILSLKRTGLPFVALLIDDSTSMGVEDRYLDPKLREKLQARVQQAGYDQLTRLNLAKTLLLERDTDLLNKLDRDYQLRTYFLAESAQLQSGSATQLRDRIRDLTPQGDATQLGRGLRTVLNDLRGTPPAAIVLLSDGITTDGESLSEAAAYARKKGVPLYTVAIGDDQPTRDLRISDLLVDETVFVNDIVQFEFTLEARGYPGQSLEIELREKNQSQPLASITVEADATGQPQKVRLPYRPTVVGDFEYTIDIPARGDERNPENNHQSRLVSVRKEQIRVLLAQSYPCFEFRYLKNLLERDTTIELKTVLQEADPQYAEADKTALAVFPLTKDELFDFDVVIFADVNPGFLSSSVLDHLSAFVREKGGGLILIAGPLYMPQAFQGTPLEPLVPVDLKTVSGPAPSESLTQGFQVVPTELGLTSSPMQLGDSPEETSRIWKDLPPLYWHLEVNKLQPAARVLAEHPTHILADGRHAPLIVLEYAGAGKVLFHAMDETWRWRLQVGDVYFARYWIQSLRYLSRSKLLGKDGGAELAVDRREYRRGEPVRLRVRFLDERLAPINDEGVNVIVQRNAQEQRTVTLRRVAANQGVFEGTLPQPLEGDYHAWMIAPQLQGSAPSCDFLIEAPPGELERLEMDRAELERSAQHTGGKMYTMNSARQLLRDLPTGRQIPLDTLPAIHLWRQWPLLLLFLLLLVAEWVTRKRVGLL